MEIVINENNNKWRDIYGNKVNIRYLPYNKISNIIYMVNYNLLLNILNRHTYDITSICGTIHLRRLYKTKS